MLEVLREDYVRTARAKGLAGSAWSGSMRCATRLIPVVTTIGLQVGTLLRRRDPDRDHLLLARRRQVAGRGDPVAATTRRCRAGSCCTATIIIGVNLIVDVLYGVINPRIRHS